MRAGWCATPWPPRRWRVSGRAGGRTRSCCRCSARIGGWRHWRAATSRAARFRAACRLASSTTCRAAPSSSAASLLRRKRSLPVGCVRQSKLEEISMTSARQQLLDMVVEPDAYNRPPRELRPLQLQAVREVFAERREQIAVLRRRADETGVREIRRFEDIVPLLFSHTVYKSYPASFVEQGRWDRMLTWLKTLSSQDPTTVDVTGVK